MDEERTAPAGRPTHSLSAPRLWFLLVATLAWLWASSVFTPWAADREPRLWLYDLLFYLRYALSFWGIAELLRLALRREHMRPSQLLPLALVVLVVPMAWIYSQTAIGLRWQVATSRDALAMSARDTNNDQRHRAGHFLIDSTRAPCGAAQPWLWLGRPHGGGTGINRALVRSGSRAPDTPMHDAFVFAPVRDGWWMAYQNAGLYQRASRPFGEPAAACVPGTIVSHRRGLAFIKTPLP